MAVGGIPLTVYGAEIASPYKEFISKQSWVGSGSAAHGPGLVMVHKFDVPWGNLGAFIRDALGYSINNGGAIHRKTPWHHPNYPWLRAMRVVDIAGVHFTGQGGAFPALFGQLANYDIARVTLGFESAPYAIKEDGEIKGEWDRYVIVKGKPQAEYLSRDGFTWKFTEVMGPNAANTVTYPGFAGVPITRKRLAWTWVQVPETYLFDANGTETKLLAAVNKINNAVFPPAGSSAGSYPAETLLFEDYDLEPRMEPAPSGLVNAVVTARSFDVTLYLTYFDPSLLGVLGGATNGWNNDPSPYDGKWYQTSGFDTTGGGGIWAVTGKYKTKDFRTIFQSAQ